MNSFFESKKTALKTQVNTFVDGMCDQLKNEVMNLLGEDKPQKPSESFSMTDVSGTSTNDPVPVTTPGNVSKHVPLASSKPTKGSKSPNSEHKFFADRSTPSYSSEQSAKGVKRPLEPVSAHSTVINIDNKDNLDDSDHDDIDQSAPFDLSKKPKIEPVELNNQDQDIANSSVGGDDNLDDQYQVSNHD